MLTRDKKGRGIVLEEGMFGGEYVGGNVRIPYRDGYDWRISSDATSSQNGNGNGNENISNAPPTVDRRRIT